MLLADLALGVGDDARGVDLAHLERLYLFLEALVLGVDALDVLLEFYFILLARLLLPLDLADELIDAPLLLVQLLVLGRDVVQQLFDFELLVIYGRVKGVELCLVRFCGRLALGFEFPDLAREAFLLVHTFYP